MQAFPRFSPRSRRALFTLSVGMCLLTTSVAAQTPTSAVKEDGAKETAATDGAAKETAAPTADELAIRATLQSITAAATAKDAGAFRAQLSPGFISVVERYLALVVDAPQDVRANYSWDSFMGTFVKENPTIQSVHVDGNRAQAKVSRLGNVGTLLFVNVDKRWLLDVQPALVERVTQAEEAKKRMSAAAPDDMPESHPPTSTSPQATPGASPEVGSSTTNAVPATMPATPATGVPAQQPVGVAGDEVADDEVARAPMPSDPSGPFDAGQPLHYVWYAPDYVFIAGAAGMYLFDGYGLLRNGLQAAGVPSLIGPSFNVDEPKLDELFDPRLDAVIGKPFLSEKVSGVAAFAIGASALGVLGLSDVRHLDFHHTHAFTVGALTATLGAVTATELAKATVRRLRPDYRERYVRAACGDVVNRPEELDCSIAEDGFLVDQAALDEGSKSFPSGHSAFSFAAATYGALYLGGEFIWGKDASMVATPLAALGATAMLSAAAFVSATRFSDNKHHLEDVMVGSVLGTGIAAASYFLHFDLDGNARWRGFNVSPIAYDEGGGVQVSGRF